MKKKKRTESRAAEPASRGGEGQRQAMGIEQALDVALSHHQAGSLETAETIYRQVIAFQPDNYRALHLLGVVALQREDFTAALALFDRAVAVKPGLPEAHSNRGNALRGLGRTSEAEASYRKAIAADSAFAMAHYNLGNILLAGKRFDEAAAHFNRALSADPRLTEARINLGMAFKETGKLKEAENCYRKALELRPELAVCHYNLGNILLDTGRPAEAAASYERAVAREPGYIGARLNLGAALRDLGRLGEAAACYERALADSPADAQVYVNYGAVLRDLGRPADAESCYRKALDMAPDAPLAHFNLGNALRDQGRLDEAVSSYRRAVALEPGATGFLINLGNALRDSGKPAEAVTVYGQARELEPGNPETLVNLGNAHKELGELEQAVSLYHQALSIRPDMAEIHYNLGTVFQDQCLLADAVACYRRVLELKPDHTVAHSNLLMNIQYDLEISPEDLLRESRAWDTVQLAGIAVTPHPRNAPDPERPLRIGYVSGDLRRHPVGYFLDGVLKCHDPEQFRVHCYANQSFGDDLTERLRDNSAVWREIFGRSDDEVADLIRADDIDILVDLAGHTARNRLMVFGRKPAPVQATWAGYVGTTGLSAMDYLISDDRETPGGTDHWYAESIMRLPDCYVCYTPPDYAPPVAPLPASGNGYATFGCFNNLAKINPAVIGLWIELLREIPDARLLMVTKALGDPGISRRFRDAFDAGGVGERVDFRGMVPHRELLGKYGDVDVALDPFPYSGGLTTLESLWMGVPVITLGGDRFASRHSLSHLAAAGLPELIAGDRTEYVGKAVSLAGDLPRLAELRRSMRDRLAASPLCDAPRFTRNLEQAYRNMWRGWCRNGSSPAAE